MADDEATQATNDDASECKRSAVQLGYWTDNYISFFVKQFNRKTPEINRGYYARVKGIQIFLEKFIELSNGNGQIINLGAGFDTLYWKLKDVGKIFVNFIEVDFPSITARKCYNIKKNNQLIKSLSTEGKEIKFSTTDLHAANYHLVGTDLRHISDFIDKLKQSEVNFDLPTLFITECVLVYVDTNSTSHLLQYLAQSFSNSMFINYEQVNMLDNFGKIMLSNLRDRGCLLAGVSDCESLESQQKRFIEAGWQGAKAWTMKEIYYSFLKDNFSYIESIEMLDEQELLIQLLQHYCICIAWNGDIFNCLSKN